jgi:hypothetical protein
MKLPFHKEKVKWGGGKLIYSIGNFMKKIMNSIFKLFIHLKFPRFL